MSSRTLTMRENAAARWAVAKPLAVALAIGLVAGPIISGMSGFQVRTSTAAAATRSSVVEQQAAFCAERARGAGTPAAAPLDWQARNDLARRFATMPGSTTADPDVVYACSGRLAN